jgi:hypothetical protein
MNRFFIVVALTLAWVGNTQASPVPPGVPESNACEYMNFVVFGDFPGYDYPDGLAARAIVRETEEMFSRELERAGFHRVRHGETPWFFLRAVLQSSSLRSDAVSGIVELGPRSNLHRELAMAPASESNAVSDIGMIALIEASTRSAGNDLGATSKLEELARSNAQRVRDQTYPVLSALCEWKTDLDRDGMTPEELRRQLVDEMGRIRRMHRESEQRKGLRLEVEP